MRAASCGQQTRRIFGAGKTVHLSTTASLCAACVCVCVCGWTTESGFIFPIGGTIRVIRLSVSAICALQTDTNGEGGSGGRWFDSLDLKRAHDLVLVVASVECVWWDGKFARLVCLAFN